MKKLIGLMVVLMTIVTLSVSAQTCPTAWEKPIFVGDVSPCRNDKNVVYTLANYYQGLPITWKWCRGVIGQIPTSAGFVPSEYRWKSPSMTTISDGVTTVSSSTGAWLYTTQTAVSVSYKSRGGSLICEFKDSCGVWQNLYTSDVFISCSPTTLTQQPISVVDTGNTILNATVIHDSYNMSFNFDSIVGLKKPYTGIQMLKRGVNSSCSNYAVGGLLARTDGFYTPIRQSAMPSLPFVVAYGWSWYYPSAPTTTFRLTGLDGDGNRFETLPFTITTTFPSTVSYPVLPAP